MNNESRLFGNSFFKMIHFPGTNPSLIFTKNKKKYEVFCNRNIASLI